MIRVRRINHVGIRVSHLQTTRDFYEQLGFQFLAGPVGPEPVAIMEHPCGVNLNFILNATVQPEENILMDIDQKHPGYTHMALEVDDIHEVQKQLQEFGVTITEGPVTTNNGSILLFIRDPDSNVIEFHQPAGKG
ncbi:VOC family protein [Endozoicomonas sp. 8E]|uniref:VOC family protein n=1 Tax=Endozoicomonas sp. 8E TaxID=3035692 RepID=UPI002939464F|nr:VOC family protein [Endozoicomonas sp. 8E]WOG25515.1 VOC family protein [Endozoicomonas sp. 8E]